MRVGLVLGAGGVLGASWLIGALEALESETGWRARDAEIVVGTSAGSVVGSLISAGLAPQYLAAYASGQPAGELDELQDRVEPERFRLQLALPPIGPGSWRMALGTLRHPRRHPPATVLGGWLPRGVLSTRPIRSLVERFAPGGWPEAPELWVVACDYRSGRRIGFGREDAPPAELADAVAASCAIPAFYHPVCIGGRRYVDGGLCSTSNLDLLCGRGLDVVVCLNPMSTAAEVTARTPGDRLAGAIRSVAGARLAREAGKLRAQGTEVVLVQPTAEDLPGIGANLMNRSRRIAVMERAVQSTARDLRARRGELPRLGRARRRRAAAA